MIFVRDKGRMCNNILQYGHVYAWGMEHGRETLSMRFAYKYPYFHICSTRGHNFFVYVCAKYLAKWGLLPVVSFHQPGEATEEKEHFMLTHKNVLVEGWEVRFYDLFLKYRKEIVALFDFKPSIHAQIRAYLSENSQGADIKLGMHIRRGDYKVWMGGRYFYEDKVYADYIRRFLALYPGKRVVIYICGNDPTLDEEYYRKSFPDVTILFPKGNPGEDLCLLSKCDYLMGAPSTFSLVAAMYRDIPLCWMEERDAALTQAHFKKFDTLFRCIK